MVRRRGENFREWRTENFKLETFEDRKERENLGSSQSSLDEKIRECLKLWKDARNFQNFLVENDWKKSMSFKKIK